jgi:hypothetical protein
MVALLIKAISVQALDRVVVARPAVEFGPVAGLSDKGRELVQRHFEPAERKRPPDLDAMHRAFVFLPMPFIIWRAHHEDAGRNDDHLGADLTLGEGLTWLQSVLLSARIGKSTKAREDRDDPQDNRHRTQLLPGQDHDRAPSDYRTAIGATLDPVAPRSLSGSTMKANSLALSRASSSRSRFSIR